MMLGANKFRDPFGQREGWGSSEPGEVWNRAKSPKAIILAMQWLCALTIFISMSNQKSGLYGPNIETCERCNLGGQCMTQRGELRGQGCGYSAFSQFQYLCAVGVLWWLGSALLLALYLLGRSPPPMTEFLIYAAACLMCFSGACAASSTCDDDPIVDGFHVCTGATSARTACTFGFLLWVCISASCWLTFRDWKSVSWEGIPEPVAGIGLRLGLGSLGSIPGYRSHPPHAYPPGHILTVPAATQTY